MTGRLARRTHRDRTVSQHPKAPATTDRAHEGTSISAGNIERIDHEVDRLRAENEELRRQLVQMQKMSAVGSLASSITHEFNNVLTTIINYAKMGLTTRT